MQFTCDIQTIRDATKRVAPAISKAGALAVLMGVRIDANAGTVRLTGTNLDLTVDTTIPADVATNGTVLLPYRLLKDSVAKGKGTISFELGEGDDTVQIVNGLTHRARIMPLGDYPRLPDGSKHGEMALIPVDQLAKVSVAASSDGSRPILTGVLYTGDRLAATDSYRLHVEDLDGDPLGVEVNIPATTVRTVAKAAAQAKATHVEFRYGDKDASFKMGDTVWTTRLIEGQWPNYKQLIPTNQPNVAVINRAILIDALTSLKAAVRYNTTPVRIEFAGEGDATMTVIEQDAATVDATVPVAWREMPFTGRIAFNPGYMLEAVTVTHGDLVVLSFVDALKPALITASGFDSGLRLIMPVRIP